MADQFVYNLGYNIGEKLYPNARLFYSIKTPTNGTIWRSRKTTAVYGTHRDIKKIIGSIDTLHIGQYDATESKIIFFSHEQLRANADVARKWNMYEMSPALFNFISEQAKDEEITPLIEKDKIHDYIGEYASRNRLYTSGPCEYMALDETLANLVGSEVGTRMCVYETALKMIEAGHLTFGEESKRNRVEALKVRATWVTVTTIGGVVCLAGFTPSFHDDLILFDLRTQKHIGWKLRENSEPEWLEEPQDWSVGSLILYNESEYLDAIGKDN